MSSFGPSANVQARKLLETMWSFLLPLIQTVCGKTTNDMDIHQFLSGIEADSFVGAIENYMTSMMSCQCSQSDTRKTSIEVPMKNVAKSHKMIKNEVVHQPALYQSVAELIDHQKLKNGLQKLHIHIAQTFPIRLLCLEPQKSGLRISLKERADIYNCLAAKFRADCQHWPQERSMWRHSVDEWISNQTRYAILSHTWTQTPGELTYDNWQKGLFSAKQSKCQKVVNFCKATWEDYGITFGWIDTVCINKESSAELDESIRSMHAWYSKADICITYLSATTTLSDMHDDPWFTRGWTFQELVASPCLRFYDAFWKQLTDEPYKNDKTNPLIMQAIERATTMTPDELRHIQGTGISRRMELAAKRKVTRGEDIAYCLLGIFDVSISTEYGEGAERAFFRLVKEIFNSTKDVLDIFNWGGGCHSKSFKPITSLFPSSPSNYLTRSSNNLRYGAFPWHPIEPLTLTHLGLRTPIVLMPAVQKRVWALDKSNQAVGNYHANVSIGTCFDPKMVFTYFHFHLLDKSVLDQNLTGTWTCGILNFERNGTTIRIPKTCLSVLLEADRQGYKKICTERPVVFILGKKGRDSDNKTYYEIERDQLATQGMQLVTLYL